MLGYQFSYQQSAKRYPEYVSKIMITQNKEFQTQKLSSPQMYMRTEREQHSMGVEGEVDCLLGCLHRR